VVSRERVCFVEEQRGAGARGIGEHAIEVLLGFVHVLA
jgi:hypothetical protein